jgi:selenide,water dikinase
MGAQPLLALNLLMVPADLPTEAVAAILRGGAEKVREAGAILAGGHSVQDREPKFGLVALGLADPEHLLIKGGARAGDVLVLTKPVGTGVTATALKNSRVEEDDVVEAIGWMKRLNATASRLALENGIRGATDVTGFGLLGHLSEMTEASGMGAELFADGVPLLRGALRYAGAGNVPGGTLDNQSHFGKSVRFDDGVSDEMRLVLFDAQTSGGLLLAVPPDRLAGFLTQAVLEGVAHWAIGRISAEAGIHVMTGTLDEGRRAT